MRYREYFIIDADVEAGPDSMQKALAICMEKAKKRFQFPEPLSHTLHIYGSAGMRYVTVLFGANF